MELAVKIKRKIVMEQGVPQPKLKEALAFLEAEELGQALRDAGIERLKAMLSQLESQQEKPANIDTTELTLRPSSRL